MSRSAAKKADEAADALLDWLRGQSSALALEADADPAGRSGEDGSVEGADPRDDAASQPASNPTTANDDAGSLPIALDQLGAAVRHDRDNVAAMGSADSIKWREADRNAAPLRLSHTDWLYHRLTVCGPTGDLTDFQGKAVGAGTIPWQLDLDRMEEDWFHLLVSPSPPQQRTLSIGGAHVLAGQLRDAVARRHALAVARVGQSGACPLDLHALIPIPDALLRRGPDDPSALAWLWENWGTTQSLRHVAEDAAGQDERRQDGSSAGERTVSFTFWSADWTPWRALAQLRQRWPALSFDLRPSYSKP
jgi:hypothetical protein